MAARSKVPPVVDGNTIDGACSPGPGLPTWKAYWPAWFVVVDDPPAELRKKITARAMIAPPTTTAAITPRRKRRLLRTTLLAGEGAFFGILLFFFPCAGRVVLVLNGLLLSLFCFFRVDCFSCCFWFLVVVRSCPNLPDRMPGKPEDERQEDESSRPIRDPGEGVRDDLATVLQTRRQLYLPVRQWRHGRVGQPHPKHASPDEREQEPAGQAGDGECARDGAKPPGECAGPEQAARTPVIAV